MGWISDLLRGSDRSREIIDFACPLQPGEAVPGFMRMDGLLYRVWSVNNYDYGSKWTVSKATEDERLMFLTMSS